MIKKEAIIIDGKKISENILADLTNQLNKDKALNLTIPKLAIILIGGDVSSKIYIKNKIKAAEKVGIEAQLYSFDSDIAEIELLENIKQLNENPQISGIIVQLPLPNHINKLNVTMSIDPSKDVDGFHPLNIGLLYSPYKNGFVPCTAAGCLSLIKSYIEDIAGKRVVIIGRSIIVGRPAAALLLKEDCTVTICHSKTKNLAEISSSADIVISAIGIANVLTKEYFNPSAMVIDVGINRQLHENSYQLVGDVDFHSVKNHVKYITPVPGGVGPMTVAYLLVNTYFASRNKWIKT